MRLRPAVLLACLLAPLAAAPASAEKAPKVLAGVDVLIERGFRDIKGKKVGLITNQTGLDSRGRSTVDVLAGAPGVELKALFSPEHGFTGTLERSEISSGTYTLPTGRTIPLFSLYGATKAPSAQMLKGLDALLFDVQDIGARFYTYAATMGLAMEAASKHDVDFIVLDRPNPITGVKVEGPLLDPENKHFTAYFDIPVRHGLTMGEIARLHNILGRVGARLQVVPLKHWRRAMWYDETGLKWVKTSPNMPDIDAAALYPGIGCFEATNLLVGRGTPVPFRWIGAKWMDPKAVLKRLKAARLPGVRFSAKSYTLKRDIYRGRTRLARKGTRCPGIRIKITDRSRLRPLDVFAYLAAALRDTQHGKFRIRGEELARMIGTKRFIALYLRGAKPSEFISLFDKDARRFENERAAFLLY